jgi:hypothetical protein
MKTLSGILRTAGSCVKKSFALFLAFSAEAGRLDSLPSSQWIQPTQRAATIEEFHYTFNHREVAVT